MARLVRKHLQEEGGATWDGDDGAEEVNKLDVFCRKTQLRLADRMDVRVRVNQVCGFHDQVDGGHATYQIRGNWWRAMLGRENQEF